MSDVWLNSNTGLFLMEDIPRWLDYCRVDRIEWYSEMHRVCPYCGSDTDGKCPNCGGVGGETTYGAGGTHVTLSGMLPQASVLFFLPGGCILEVLHKTCGPRASYHREETILRFRDCKVLDRWMQDVVINNPARTDALEIAVKIECVAELILREC